MLTLGQKVQGIVKNRQSKPPLRQMHRSHDYLHLKYLTLFCLFTSVKCTCGSSDAPAQSNVFRKKLDQVVL